MICKYCGSSMDGAICPSCGRESPTVGRSMQLDRLMEQPVQACTAAAKPASSPVQDSHPVPVSVPAPVSDHTPAAPAPTYDQGLREGYQRGLKEGYENGCREGSPKPEEPAPRAGLRPAAVALLCAVCAAVAVLITGLVTRGSGIPDGGQENTGLAAQYEAQLKAEYENMLKDEYERGRQTGIEESSDRHADELEQAKDAARSEGYLRAFADLDTLSFPYEEGAGKNETVQEIQAMLDHLGFYPEHNPAANADGQFGAGTRNSVAAFQLSAGLLTDRNGQRAGVVDMETYVRLVAAYRGVVPVSPVPDNTSSMELIPTEIPVREPSPSPAPAAVPSSDPAGAETQEPPLTAPPVDDSSEPGEFLYPTLTPDAAELPSSSPGLPGDPV